MSNAKPTKAPKAPRNDPPSFVPKRGRPTQDQVAAIENAILLVARTLFLDAGYGNTSMDSVAASAGVAKGTLYARYPTKPDLYRAVVADRLGVWRAAAKANEAALPPGELQMGDAELLIRFGNAFLEQMEQPEVAAFDRLVTSEAGRFPEIAEEFRTQGYHKATEQLAQDLVRLGASASWPVSDAQGVAVAFTSALLGWHVNRAPGPASAGERQKFVARLVAIFAGGRSSW